MNLEERTPCPSMEDLFELATATDLHDASKNALLSHAEKCQVCFARLGAIKRSLSGTMTELRPEANLQKKLLARYADKRFFSWDILWLALFGFFMILSFFIHRFFMQFLVLAMVCAAKWLLVQHARHLPLNIIKIDARDKKAASDRDAAKNRSFEPRERFP